MQQSRRAVISGPAAWSGPQIQDDESWVHHLDADAVAEIDRALADAKRARARAPFAKDLFPLERLTVQLDAILQEIEHGRGFALLRGIPRSRYTDEECELIYWGLGMHFGTPVSQNARGNLILQLR